MSQKDFLPPYFNPISNTYQGATYAIPSKFIMMYFRRVMQTKSGQYMIPSIMAFSKVSNTRKMINTSIEMENEYLKKQHGFGKQFKL